MNFIKSFVVKPNESIDIDFGKPVLRIGYLQTSSNSLYISKADSEDVLFYLPNSRSYCSHFNFTTGVTNLTIYNSGEGNANISIIVEKFGN